MIHTEFSVELERVEGGPLENGPENHHGIGHPAFGRGALTELLGHVVADGPHGRSGRH